MDNQINPNPANRRVYREEVIQYDVNGVPLPPTPVVPVQRVVPVQPVVPMQPVYDPATVDARATHADYGDSRVDNLRETYYDANGNLMEHHEQVFDDTYTRRQNILDRTSRIIYFLVGALEVLLLLRFVFKILGAEPNSGIVSFIYGLSNPFTIFFNGILSDYKISSNSVLELSTLVAMALYALLAWGVVALLDAFFTPNRSSRQVLTSTRRRQ